MPDREVSFSRSPPDIRSVPSLSDSSNDDDEIGQAIWYTQSERDRIQREIVDTVRAWRRRRSGLNHQDDVCLCLRGIEHLLTSRRVLRAREAAKAAVVRAVLDEQSRQRRAAGGVRDPLAIRAESASASRGARLRALENARGDAEEASSSSSRATTAAARHALPLGREAAGRDSLLRILDRAIESTDTNATNETMQAAMQGTDEHRNEDGNSHLLQVLSRALALSENDTHSSRSTSRITVPTTAE